MKLTRFRSCWGVEPGLQLQNWKQIFPQWKAKGYNGIEVDIFLLQKEEEFYQLKSLCDEVGFQIVPMVKSSWLDYVNPRPPGLTPKDHLETYRQQLELARILDPVKINAHSGADHWTREQSVEFYKGTFQIESELGLTGKVSHETHRNRSLFNPYVTEYILEQVPNLRLTADISHWVVVCERVLNGGPEDRALLAKIIPHVHHVHARMGTIQSSQCPEPLNPIFAEERAFFEWFWLKIIDHYQKQGNESLSFVPEYGPFPYHPFNSSKSYGDVADEEGIRLQSLFNASIAKE
ncbi:xylose isomerase TIM barrel [Delphinella strobiligena]|nr:xylose isomerase TIM barrel [Delphinella strobiligena]